MIRANGILPLLFLSASLAQAGLLGTNVTLVYQFGAATTTDLFTIGSGTELTCPGPASVCTVLTSPMQTVHTGDRSIRYTRAGTNSRKIAPTAFVVQNLGPGFTIGSVTLTTNIPGLTNARVSFTGSSVTVNMTDLAIAGPASTFQLDLAELAIPEPAAWLLGITGLGALARRRVRPEPAARPRVRPPAPGSASAAPGTPPAGSTHNKGGKPC